MWLDFPQTRLQFCLHIDIFLLAPGLSCGGWVLLIVP